MAAPNFNNGVSGLFDLTYPPSPALSSSEFEDPEASDLEHLSLTDENKDIEEYIASTVAPPRPTIVKHLVNALLQAWPYHQSHEMTLLNYLHHKAATLTDVEALILALGSNLPIVSKLAGNIGYFHTPTSTPSNPSPELQAMLGHMLTQGDDIHRTYEMTRMHLQYYNDQLCQVDPRHRLRVHNEHMAREQYLKTLDWEARQRRKGMPGHMKEQSMPGSLPRDCITPGDVITACYGMSYAEYMRILHAGQSMPRGPIPVAGHRTCTSRSTFASFSNGSSQG